MHGYNFTERTRKVLAFAREEANALRHEYVGTEHILLGLIREGSGVAATVLQNLGVDQEALRDRMLGIIKPGKPGGHRADLPYTTRAKKVLELGMEQARELNHKYVGTEHLLLGLIAEEKGIAAQVLVEAGVSLDIARAEVLRILGTETVQSAGAARGHSLANTTFVAATPVLPLTDRGRRILAAAGDVAAERGSPLITAVDVAIALIEHEEGAANAVLDHLGAEPEVLLAALEPLAGAKAEAVAPESMVMLDRHLADRIAALQTGRKALHGPSPGTGDLLLAVLESSSEIAEVFAANGATIERVREELRRISG